MPRWSALPEDLDPQMREFTVQLRRLADRGGLSTAALADRTGYGKTSWERYLGGRLLAPKGAVIALAEATGTDPGPLTTLWERAERSWTRAESDDDHTLQAIGITESQAALGDLAVPREGTGRGSGLRAGAGEGGGLAAAPGIAGPAGVSPKIPAQPADSAAAGVRDSVPDGAGAGDGSDAARASGRDAAPDGRSGTGSGGGSPDAEGGDGGTGAASRADSRTAVGDADAPVKNSWGVAGYRGPSKASVRPGTRPRPSGSAAPASSAPSPHPPAGASGVPARPSAAGAQGPSAQSQGVPGGAPGAAAWPPGLTVGTPAASPRTQGVPSARIPGGAAGTVAIPAPAPGVPGGAAGRQPEGLLRRWSAHRQQVVMFFAGLVGAGALIAGVFFLTHRGGDGTSDAGATASPSPSAPARTSPPPGVKCTGAACTGKDAEAMGCSGDLVSTAKTATVGTTTLEVRYSRACGTAWGRITSGAPGDTVRVTVGKVRQTGDITAVGDTIGYTPMVAVRDPAQATACATLASGETGCTD